MRVVGNRGAATVVAAFLFLACASVANADATKARAHFERGTSLYQVGEYRQALEEFKQAHIEKADPAFLYNIAQCHRQLGEFKEALLFYRRYLSLAPDTALRPEVEKRIHEMEATTARSDVPMVPTPQTAATQSQASPPPVPEPPPIKVPEAALGPAPTVVETRPAQAATSRPFYARWWFWTILGAGAAVVATTLILSRTAGDPDCLGISPCGSVR